MRYVLVLLLLTGCATVGHDTRSQNVLHGEAPGVDMLRMELEQ